jgi:hypothetical protein
MILAILEVNLNGVDKAGIDDMEKMESAAMKNSNSESENG